MFCKMKTPSNSLWQLIHSLSSGEKLFFKRNFAVTRSVKQRLYIQLFDAIATQKEYNETTLLKRFQSTLTKKNIAYQKHYLQRLICEAIVQYDSLDNASQDVYKQVQLVRIYRKKGLLNEAQAIWKKAVARARKTESFALLNLLKTEFEKMVLFSNLYTSYDELHSIFKGNIITYAEYAEMITLRDIYTETLLLKRKAHYDLDDSLKKRIIVLLQQIDQREAVITSRSFWLRHYYRMGKATLLYLLNDAMGSMKLLEDVLPDWKENPEFINTDGEYYIEVLYLVNHAGILNGSYEYVANAFNDNINDLIQQPSQRANFEALKYLAFNKIYNKTARYNEVEKLIRHMKLKYKLWEPSLNSDLNRSVNLSLAIACFVLEQYDDALYFARRVVTYFKDGTREEQLAVANVLLLLITFSLDNSRLFDAQYKTTYTYFYKRKKRRPFETALVQCLYRTFYMKDNTSKIAEYHKTLAVLERTKDDIVQQMTFSTFNYHGWLLSKVQRIPYRQFVENKVRQEMPVRA